MAFFSKIDPYRTMRAFICSHYFTYLFMCIVIYTRRKNTRMTWKKTNWEHSQQNLNVLLPFSLSFFFSRSFSLSLSRTDYSSSQSYLSIYLSDLLEGLKIYYVYLMQSGNNLKKRVNQGVTFNLIWWWGSGSGDLMTVVDIIMAINPSFIHSRWYYLFGSNGWLIFGVLWHITPFRLYINFYTNNQFYLNNSV